MNILLVLGSVIFSVLGLVAWIIIVIDAWKDAWWKGLLCIIGCGIYFLYYAVFEFEHDRKWEIVIMALAGSAIGTALANMVR
jgi:hypothetical protein